MCVFVCVTFSLSCDAQGVCTEAGMYALRERRVHVTQEDFEMAVAKVQSVAMVLGGLVLILCSHGSVCSHCSPSSIPSTPPTCPPSPFCLLPQIMQKDADKNMSVKKLWK